MSKETVRLMGCKCKSEFQDKTYNGQRVFNFCEKKGKIGTNNGYKCTVCGNIKTPGA